LARSARGEPVVVDTSVWIPFLQGRGGALADELRRLIRADRVAVPGIVVAEILHGARGGRDAARLRSALRGARLLRVGREDYEEAGLLAAQLRRGGATIPLSDALVARAAISHGLALLADDAHFDAIPAVTRHPVAHH
jgi:predicted nucleic acid-binding protein